MVRGVRKEVANCVPYVSGKSMDAVMKEYGLEKVVKLGSNENAYGPYPVAAEAMKSEINQINIYPEKNFIKLKELVGKMYGVDGSYVSLGHGAGNVLDTVAKTFLEEGDEVIIPTQTYGLYGEISKIMGATVVYVDLDENFRIDIDAVKAKITDKTKMIWLCNPNNPTGTLLEKEKMDAFVEALPENTWLIMDEAYSEMAEPELLPNTMGYINEGKNVIMIRTFSKYYGIAGGRIGYMVADPEVIAAYDTVSEPFNANRMGLAAAVALIEDGLDTCKKYGDIMKADRTRMGVELDKMGCTVTPTFTNFVFFETAYPCGEIGERLLKEGVIVRPCGGWGYPNHVRVSIGTTEENNFFLEKIEKVFADLKKAK